MTSCVERPCFLVASPAVISWDGLMDSSSSLETVHGSSHVRPWELPLSVRASAIFGHAAGVSCSKQLVSKILDSGVLSL